MQNILTIPDQKLRLVSEKVKSFDKDLETFVNEMIGTMYAAKGIGLAAPQIGIQKRIIVVDISEDQKTPQEFINPEIIASSGTQSSKEGCLSIPGFRDAIKRKKNVTVRAQNFRGEEFVIEGSDLLAACLQHEIDHLDGILFIDHLSRLKRESFKKWAIKEGIDDPV